MIRTCATPGCSTLTFGEICLGCMQRSAGEHDEALDAEASGEEHAAPEHAHSAR